MRGVWFQDVGRVFAYAWVRQTIRVRLPGQGLSRKTSCCVLGSVGEEHGVTSLRPVQKSSGGRLRLTVPDLLVRKAAEEWDFAQGEDSLNREIWVL